MENSIFDFLNIDIDCLEVGTKNSKSTAAKVEPTIINKVSKELINVKQGLTVYTLFYEKFTLNRELFSSDNVEIEEIKDLIGNKYKEYTPSLCKIKVIDNGNLFAYFSSDFIKDEELPLTSESNWLVKIADFEYEFEVSTITVKEVKDSIKQVFTLFENTEFICDKEKSIIVPIMQGVIPNSFVMPSDFSIFFGEKFEITISDLNLICKPEVNNDTSSDNNDDTVDDENDDEESDENEDNIESTGNIVNPEISIENSISMDDIKKIFILKYPETFSVLRDCYTIYENNGTNIIWPTINDSISTTSSKESVKKEELYSTEGTVLSLAFVRFNLEPSMFKGKTQITKKELLKFIRNDYPEYSEERTKIDYDVKKKLIIAYLTGSKKGSILIKERDQNSHVLQKYTVGNVTYRVERTPVGLFIGTNHELIPGEFSLHLPKIPDGIFKQIHNYFYKISQYGKSLGYGPLEAACQIFFDKINKKYFVYYPKSKCSRYFVDYQRNYHLESSEHTVLVMDIHSHHELAPIFSDVDNEDEKGTRLFGVIGYLTEKDYTLNLRAGTGGLYIRLNEDNIIDKSAYSIMNDVEIDYSRIEVDSNLLLAI